MGDFASFISWNLSKDVDRDRFIWPADAVLDRWIWAEREGWCLKRPEPETADVAWRPESDADQHLKHLLEQRDGGWWSRFGKGTNGEDLYWDPFHLPVFDPVNGDLSPKHPSYDGRDGWSRATFDAFNEALWARMVLGTDLDSTASCRGFVIPNQTDVSSGAVGTAQSMNPTLFVDFSGSLFGHGFSVQDRVFGHGVRVFKSIFDAAACFDGACFGDEARFDRARFGNYALFRGSRFGDDAIFTQAQFGNWAIFELTQFGDFTYFKNARFENSADFSDTQFGEETHFEGAEFQDWAHFEGAQFGGTVHFDGAQFGNRARFLGTEFLGRANFRLGPVLPLPSRQKASPFRIRPDAAHEETAGFALSDYEFVTDLNAQPDWQKDCAFYRIDFSNAIFLGRSEFHTRLFLDSTSFAQAFFSKPPEFHDALLHRDTDFLNTHFFAAPGASVRAVRRHLYAVNNRDAEEVSQMPLSTDEMHQANQHRDGWADKSAFVEGRRPFWNDLAASRRRQRNVAIRERQRAKALELYDKALRESVCREGKPRDALTRTARRFESAFQTLKIAMEESRARSDEQYFFALELLSRRQRRDHEVLWLERHFSYLYEITSGFGRQSWRVLFWIFIVFPVLITLSYMLATVPLAKDPAAQLSIFFRLEYGWYLVQLGFNPLASVEQSPLLGLEEGQTGSMTGTEFVLSVIGLFHRVGTTVLLFLLALTIRRRFQIT